MSPGWMVVLGFRFQVLSVWFQVGSLRFRVSRVRFRSSIQVDECELQLSSKRANSNTAGERLKPSSLVLSRQPQDMREAGGSPPAHRYFLKISVLVMFMKRAALPSCL